MIDNNQIEINDYNLSEFPSPLASPTPLIVPYSSVISPPRRRGGMLPVIHSGVSMGTKTKEEWDKIRSEAIVKWHIEVNGNRMRIVPDLVNGKVVRVKDIEKKSILKRFIEYIGGYKMNVIYGAFKECLDSLKFFMFGMFGSAIAFLTLNGRLDVFIFTITIELILIVSIFVIRYKHYKSVFIGRQGADKISNAIIEELDTWRNK